MRLRNSTDWPDHFLRRMTAWVCAQLDTTTAIIHRAQFTRTTYCPGRGRAWSSGRMLVRIGPASKFPHTYKYPNRRRAPEYQIVDREEELVQITAHEAFHLICFRERANTAEAPTEFVSLEVLEKFRANREALLAEWSDPPALRITTPAPSPVEQRALAAQNALDTWTRKMKLAQTKVRKYRLRVRYYERKAARPPVGGA